MLRKSNGELVVPDPPLTNPALRDDDLNFVDAIARGEMGVLSFEPCKSLIRPCWAFRTVPVATNSAEVLREIFELFCVRGDFAGADVSRKSIQMGMTRARRYANQKGRRKYDQDGKQRAKRSGDDVDGKRREEEASNIFTGYRRRCTGHKEYLRLKQDWTKSKAQE